jgi:hypothetical protein
MREIPVLFVAVPMLPSGSTLRRPTTDDTIDAWVATNPGPCTALFVADQPFCGYQWAVLHRLLPTEIDFDMVGQEANPEKHPLSAAISLDSIARWLYRSVQ